MPDGNPNPPGRLEVICGPMFAGKSTTLIARLQASGVPFTLCKPVSDTRYAHDHVVTHDGLKLEARAIADPSEILAMHTPVLGIDEAHFFGAGLIAPVLKLLASGKRVIIAGIDRDHTGAPFEPFPRLLCEADEVVKLASRCARCNAPAVHSQRLIASTARIVVGGAESYEPRCRRCFVPGV